MIAMLAASVTCVLWNASRQVRLFNTAVPARTVERGTQSEHNPVDSIVIPTSICCSPGGQCYHTSGKCEGLKNVPMNAFKSRRSCMYCVQRDGRRNGEQHERCTATTGVDCTWPATSLSITQHVQTHETMRSSVVVAWVAACTVAREPLREAMMRSGRLSKASAERNDDFRRLLIRQAGAHDLAGRCYDERGQAMSSAIRH